MDSTSIWSNGGSDDIASDSLGRTLHYRQRIHQGMWQKGLGLQYQIIAGDPLCTDGSKGLGR